MISISDKLLEEIVDQLDCGMKCYFNKSSGKLIIAINSDNLIDEEFDTQVDDLKPISDDRSNYIEFNAMNSHDSFDVMAEFANGIDNDETRQILVSSLNTSKPFRNFKAKIDNLDQYRQKWFSFKRNKYIDYVKSQIPNDLLQ